MATAMILPPTEEVDLSESLYEVVDGNTVEMPHIGARENGLAFLLAIKIANLVDPLRIGRVWPEMLYDFRPKLDRQRRPDVSFVSAER